MKNRTMSSTKGRGNRGQFQQRPELDEFEYVDVENVCYESDEKLYGHLYALIEVRENGFKDGADTVPVEVEICYIRRELKVRADRREAHDRYVRSLQEENSVLEQAVVMATPTESN